MYWTFGLQRMQCMICSVIFQEDSDANHDVAGTWTSIRNTYSMYSVRSWAPNSAQQQADLGPLQMTQASAPLLRMQ